SEGSGTSVALYSHTAKPRPASTISAIAPTISRSEGIQRHGFLAPARGQCRKLVAAAFFARPFGAAAAAAAPAWRALTEVRAVGGFGAPAGGVERVAELAPVPRPVRLVPLGAGVFPEDFDAEDGGVEARRTPAARRAPPVVGFCARRERSDEPRDERRESLMAAP